MTKILCVSDEANYKREGYKLINVREYRLLCKPLAKVMR